MNREEVAVNLTRYELYQQVAVAFIAGQVVDLPFKDGIQLVNMKAVVRLSLYETDHPVEEVAFFDQHQESVKDCTAAIISDARRQLATNEFRSVLERTFAPPKPTAFIVTKFGDKTLDSAYQRVLKPVFAKFGLEAVRIDEVEDSGKINDQVLDHIAESRLVYADLSGERPNCYYETGFAHALGKQMILSIRANESIHFDLRTHRFIQWETEHELEGKLTNRLKAIDPSKAF